MTGDGLLDLGVLAAALARARSRMPDAELPRWPATFCLPEDAAALAASDHPGPWLQRPRASSDLAARSLVVDRARLERSAPWVAQAAPPWVETLLGRVTIRSLDPLIVLWRPAPDDAQLRISALRALLATREHLRDAPRVLDAELGLDAEGRAWLLGFRPAVDDGGGGTVVFPAADAGEHWAWLESPRATDVEAARAAGATVPDLPAWRAARGVRALHVRAMGETPAGGEPCGTLEAWVGGEPGGAPEAWASAAPGGAAATVLHDARDGRVILLGAEAARAWTAFAGGRRPDPAGAGALRAARALVLDGEPDPPVAADPVVPAARPVLRHNHDRTFACLGVVVAVRFPSYGLARVAAGALRPLRATADEAAGRVEVVAGSSGESEVRADGLRPLRVPREQLGAAVRHMVLASATRLHAAPLATGTLLVDGDGLILLAGSPRARAETLEAWLAAGGTVLAEELFALRPDGSVAADARTGLELPDRAAWRWLATAGERPPRDLDGRYTNLLTIAADQRAGTEHRRVRSVLLLEEGEPPAAAETLVALTASAPRWMRPPRWGDVSALAALVSGARLRRDPAPSPETLRG